MQKQQQTKKIKDGKEAWKDMRVVIGKWQKSDIYVSWVISKMLYKFVLGLYSDKPL